MSESSQETGCTDFGFIFAVSVPKRGVSPAKNLFHLSWRSVAHITGLCKETNSERGPQQATLQILCIPQLLMLARHVEDVERYMWNYVDFMYVDVQEPG